MNTHQKKFGFSNKIIIDKEVLNCYIEINIDSIPGGESPPRRPSECRPRVTQLGAFFLPEPENSSDCSKTRSCGADLQVGAPSGSGRPRPARPKAGLEAGRRPGGLPHKT